MKRNKIVLENIGMTLSCNSNIAYEGVKEKSDFKNASIVYLSDKKTSNEDIKQITQILEDNPMLTQREVLAFFYGDDANLNNSLIGFYKSFENPVLNAYYRGVCEGEVAYQLQASELIIEDMFKRDSFPSEEMYDNAYFTLCGLTSVEKYFIDSNLTLEDKIKQRISLEEEAVKNTQLIRNNILSLTQMPHSIIHSNYELLNCLLCFDDSSNSQSTVGLPMIDRFNDIVHHYSESKKH